MKTSDFEYVLDSALSHSKDQEHEKAETLCNALLMVKDQLPTHYQLLITSILIMSDKWFPEEQFYYKVGYNRRNLRVN